MKNWELSDFMITDYADNLEPWTTRAVCCKCGWHTRAPFGSLFHVHISCCPKCGNPKPQFSEWDENWKIETMKFISTSVWYKPKTWSTGYWQKRQENI